MPNGKNNQSYTGDDFIYPDFFDQETWRCVPEPFITIASATEVTPGQSLTIDGYNFGTHPRWVSVFFDSCEATVTQFSEDQLIVDVPKTVADVTEMIVSVNGMMSSGITLTVKPYIEHVQTNTAQSHLEIIGSSHPCLVDVEMTSSIIPGFSKTLQTSLVNGRNVIPLNLGGVSPNYVSYQYQFIESMTPYLAIPQAMSLPTILYSVYIQTITRKETDKTGKERTVWYFFRDGKWWRILDPKKKSRDDPELVDLEDDKPKKNFVEADKSIQDKLNKQFFPTDWDKHWGDFSDVSKQQLQIMFIMLTQMNGIDAEDADLVMQIRKMLGRGKKVDEILELKESKVYSAMVGVAIGVGTLGGAAIVKKAGLGGLLRKFLGKFFGESRLFKKVTRRKESADMLELDVYPNSKLGKQGKVKGDLRGKVNRDKGRLDVDSSTGNFENNGAGRGFVKRLGLDWLEEMRKFARKKGLKKVRATQWACTPEGVEAAKKLGMRPVPGRTRPDGIGQWELILDAAD